MLNKFLLNNKKSRVNVIRTGQMTKEKINIQNFGTEKQIPRSIHRQFSFNTMIYSICTYSYTFQVTLN